MKRFVFFMLVLAAVSAPWAMVATADTIYVDIDASGAQADGTSWQKAFTDLQEALDIAQAGDQIWVAQGTYKPSRLSEAGDPRSAAFRLINGVGVYGGFNGSETHVRQRNWTMNTTILSADIGVPGDIGDNCYHVFYHPMGLGLDATAILDGFTITGGNASGNFGTVHGDGGGIHNDGNCSPTIANCTVMDNRATAMGGGIYNSGDSNHTGSATTVINCRFIRNHAAWGGGLGVCWSSPKIYNNMFLDNSADWGGGVYLCSGAAAGSVLANCTFFGNSANGGGGISNHSAVPISNTILWGNVPDQINAGPIGYSCIQDGFAGTGNIAADPRFVDTTAAEPVDWDLHLAATSPCIDAGDNTAAGPSIDDIDGDARRLDMLKVADTGNGTPPVVDMGADEAVQCQGDFDGDGDVDGADIAELAMVRPLFKTPVAAQQFGRPDGCR